jgi:hypothetical protein
MIGILSYTAIALTAVSSVSALVLPRLPDPKQPPKGWVTDYLEDYNVYHHRYLALNCQHQHNTQFFATCCHPLLATETLQTARPAQCIPTPEQTAGPSSSDDTSSGGDDSSDEGDSTPAPVSFSSSTDSTDTSGGSGGSSHGKSGHGGGSTGGSTDTSSTDTSSTDPSTSDPSSSGGSSGGSSGDITGGFATFYNQDGSEGACGGFSGDGDYIAALAGGQYGDMNSRSPNCGRSITVTNMQNGKSVTVTVVDACPTCDNGNCVDLSPTAFNDIADAATGIVPITWHFN